MLDMERVGELKRHRDEMMGHFGGYLNHFQEFEPVVRPPTMESNYPLLEIEEVVAAGDDEAGSSSFRGVSHPPEKPSIAEEPATSLSPFSKARATSLQSHRQGVPKSFCRHSRKFVQLRT
ncbi:hypothetical protein F2Q69_00042623 [Brassica cretica]|uniref:Uncharacterized protein n=1 Tax=Brassica cretica TaxID=69181 RepID=A0A8S9ND72_BRACR|nr:hypothetical protein F2Q69_00042623 [Brassica cretica]